jgi:hypothetical protein
MKLDLLAVEAYRSTFMYQTSMEIDPLERADTSNMLVDSLARDGSTSQGTLIVNFVETECAVISCVYLNVKARR